MKNYPNDVPSRFAHLFEPYAEDAESIVIAETTSLIGEGMHGMRQLTSAVVPLNRLRTTLEGPGAQGWLRTEFSDSPHHLKGRVIDGFAFVNPSRMVFEGLVDRWTNHNVVVMMPQPRLVATYGLQPRMIESDQSIRWDDPEHVTYDVVVVRPRSKYSIPDEFTRAEVLLRRDYAEDYAGLRSRALVAVYYEQQSIAVDPELDALLGGEEYRRIDLPGVGIEIKRAGFDDEFPLFIAAWGCRLILKPTGMLPISTEGKPTLTWPGFGTVSSSLDFNFKTALDRIYVRDTALTRFEERSEFDVNPEHGGVSYEGRWELSYSNRVGRDYISYELRKLYEGCPRAVIEHVHRFAVDPSDAKSQRAALGNANIGSRAVRVVSGFAGLSNAVLALAHRVGLGTNATDIATPTPRDIEYHGWWTLPEFRPLGHVAPQEMPRAAFLQRAAALYAPLERIREKPLRQIAIAIGVDENTIKDYRSLKLLGLLAQLASTAAEAGLPLHSGASAVISRWDRGALLPELRPLFALNDLRQLGSHITSGDGDAKLRNALAVFDLDLGTLTGGWGAALDRVYDRFGDALFYLAELL